MSILRSVASKLGRLARLDPSGPMVGPLHALDRRESFSVAVEARGSATDGAAASPIVVMMLGLNDFKDVNISFGHSAGDAVLAELATRMASLISAGWRAARVDGDVFAVLPPASDCKRSSLPDLVARLMAVLAERVELRPGEMVQMAASIGAAVSSAVAVPAYELMRNAEIAMYAAKAGQQPWATYEPGLHEHAGDRLRRVSELRDAIEASQLEVHYQPIVDLDTGQPCSVEALVRWRHPERGLIPPGDFIGLAEQCGLIGAITDFVLEKVAHETRAWAIAERSLPCAVNLNVASLVDRLQGARLVETLTALAGVVTVEVTESVLADERAVAVLKQLAAAGVPCAIDDFGTGYSCLAALKGLPVATVKIDRAFIRGIETDPRDLAIVGAILELTDALGLGVIAEGIETQAAADCLRAAGVHRGQGFLFARAMPADELGIWLTARHVPAHSAVGSDPAGRSLGRAWQAGSSQESAAASAGPKPRTGVAVDVAADGLQVLLEGTRSLLRVDSSEQAVGVLMRAVLDFGGCLVPAIQAPDYAIPIDVSLGEADPMLPVAPPGSPARRNLERLLPGLVEDARTAADRANRLARLYDQVDTDPLTGLGNRRGLDRVRRLHAADSIAMVDLDNFKNVNDEYGHEDGDRTLVAFSRALRQHLRSTDLMFRLGGEEFLLVLPGTSPQGVLTALAHLREKWSSERPRPVTFSAGIAAVEDSDLSAAVLAADVALYAAKKAGRDRFELAASCAPAADRRPAINMRVGGASVPGRRTSVHPYRDV